MQSVSSPLASGELVCAGHAWHTSEAAPIAVENSLFSHPVHAELPRATLYVPATHSVQTPPSGPEDPALHKQSVCSSLASGAIVRNGHSWHTLEIAPIAMEYWAVSQLVHTAAPVATLYFPATHNAQKLPSAPV